MDPFVSRLFQIESGGNPFAVTGSNRGLGQFGPEEERQYGINDANRSDPMAQMAAVQREVSRFRPLLQSTLGRDPSPGELYLTHQQGIAGGPALLSADPNTPAWQAVRQYYGSDGIAKQAIGGNIPTGSPLAGIAPGQITAGDFTKYWINKFENPGSVNSLAFNGAADPIASSAAQVAIKNAMPMNNFDPQALAAARAQMSPGADFGSGLVNAGAALESVYNPFGAAALTSLAKNSMAAQMAGRPEFKQIGTDDLGNPKYGFVDLNRQTVTGIGATPDGAGSSMGDQIHSALSSGATGEELLKGVSPTIASIVRGISQGAQPYNPSTLMRTPQGRAALALLDQYEPGATPADYAGRASGMKDWAGGKSNEITRRAGQSVQHMGTLTNKYDALDNGPLPAVNAVVNWAKNQLGGAGPNNAQLNTTALANELGAFVRSNGGSDSSFKEWAQGFPVNGSPEQQRGAIGTVGQLFSESMNELEQKRLRAIGPAQAAKLGPLLSPDAKAALDKVTSYANGGGQTAAPAPDAPSSAAPMQGAKLAPDGNYYVPDSNRPGKYLRVDK